MAMITVKEDGYYHHIPHNSREKKTIPMTLRSRIQKIVNHDEDHVNDHVNDHVDDTTCKHHNDESHNNHSNNYNNHNYSNSNSNKKGCHEERKDRDRFQIAISFKEKEEETKEESLRPYDFNYCQKISLMIDRMEVMQFLERSRYKCTDYMLPTKLESYQSSRRWLLRSSSSSIPTTTETTTNCNTTSINTNTPLSKLNKPVDRSCRFKIAEWGYRVIDYFHLSRETVYIYMNFLDRFMEVNHYQAQNLYQYQHQYQQQRQHQHQHQHQNPYQYQFNQLTGSGLASDEHDILVIDRPTYKVLATTALLLAIKIHEPRKVNLSKIVHDLSRGDFDASDVARMELIMLRKLKWRLHPPTPDGFIMRILALDPLFDSLFPASSTSPLYASSLSSSSSSSFRGGDGILEFDVAGVQDLSLFFVELSVYDYFFVTQKESFVALAAILNALESYDLLQPKTTYAHSNTSSHTRTRASTVGCRHRKALSDHILDFVAMMFDTMGVDCENLTVMECRSRLWDVYHRSEEYKVQKTAELKKFEQKKISRSNNNNQKKSNIIFESIHKSASTSTSSKRRRAVVDMSRITSPKSVV